MKFNNLKIITLMLMILSVSSCGFFGGDERPVYQGAEYYKNLEVPPDLTEPDTGGQLRVPKPSDKALQRFRNNNSLEATITPKFDGVRMVSYAGDSWLEIDNNIEFVWQNLLEFWQGEGINLIEVRPLLGFMETDWVERLDADASYLRKLFQRLEPDQKDKFRVRVERYEELKTRLSITHTRIERIVRGEYADEVIWVSRPSDGEAEREILSRMALFAGKNKEQTVQLLENYRPYTSLVKIDETNTTALTMTGSLDFVWRRAMRALDRMSMKDIRAEKDTIYFIAGKLSDEDIKIEYDELAKSSWLMQWFTDVDEASLATDIDRKYRLEFSDANGRIQIEVKDAKNSQLTDDDGNVAGTALAEQLRNILAEKLE